MRILQEINTEIMEDRFRSLTIFEFQSRFPDDDACFKYLTELKWGAGFCCPQCGHTNYCKGKRKYDRQCTSCHRISSPTSGTLFHKVKFSMLKAFYIVYCKYRVKTAQLYRLKSEQLTDVKIPFPLMYASFLFPGKVG